MGIKNNFFALSIRHSPKVPLFYPRSPHRGERVRVRGARKNFWQRL
jgi:hypothetical protein